MSKKKLAVKNKSVSENSRRHFKYRSNECLNCGQPLDLSDVYCPYCSQLNSTKSLSLKDFITEFFSSLVSYDSRLRYTISDLLFRPGTITKNYINGKRMRYTNPFRFFLSVSIIYFLLYSFLGILEPDNDDRFVNFNDNESTTEIKDEVTQNKASETIVADSILKKNQVAKDTLTKLEDTNSKNPVTEIDDITGGFWIVNGDTIYNKNESYPKRLAKLDSLGSIERLAMKFQIFRDFYEDTEIKDANKALDSLHLENTRTNSWLYERNKAFDRIGDSPVDFINYMLSKVPFLLFFFAPFFALFFWLFYMRSKVTYMEHLIFIFHIFSFTFLGLILAILPDFIYYSEVLNAIFVGIIGPIYFYLALKKFYGQSYIKTFIKFIGLNIVFFFSSIIAAILFFAVSAAFY